MMLSTYYQSGTVGNSAIVRLNIKRNHSTRTGMSSTEEEEKKFRIIVLAVRVQVKHHSGSVSGLGGSYYSQKLKYYVRWGTFIFAGVNTRTASLTRCNPTMKTNTSSNDLWNSPQTLPLQFKALPNRLYNPAANTPLAFGCGDVQRVICSVRRIGGSAAWGCLFDRSPLVTSETRRCAGALCDVSLTAISGFSLVGFGLRC